MIVSLAGLIRAWCRVNWLLWLYLVVMFLLILLLFCFTIIAFVVTNKGPGEALSAKGYKEYRLGDHSNWLQKRVSNTKNWNRIRRISNPNTSIASQFYAKHLSPIQSGCCKPSNDCNFTYVSPTVWTKPADNTIYANPDCNTWSNDPTKLCFDCQSCKVGVLDNIKSVCKKVAIVK